MSKRMTTPETIAKLRAAALKNKPWRRSTGPKTAAGKAQAARNGRARQRGEYSDRELRAIAKALRLYIRVAAAFRKEAAKARAALRRRISGRPTRPDLRTSESEGRRDVAQATRHRRFEARPENNARGSDEGALPAPRPRPVVSARLRRPPECRQELTRAARRHPRGRRSRAPRSSSSPSVRERFFGARRFRRNLKVHAAAAVYGVRGERVASEASVRPCERPRTRRRDLRTELDAPASSKRSSEATGRPPCSSAARGEAESAHPTGCSWGRPRRRRAWRNDGGARRPTTATTLRHTSSACAAYDGRRLREQERHA
jgi:hypothetical protein